MLFLNIYFLDSLESWCSHFLPLCKEGHRKKLMHVFVCVHGCMQSISNNWTNFMKIVYFQTFHLVRVCSPFKILNENIKKYKSLGTVDKLALAYDNDFNLYGFKTTTLSPCKEQLCDLNQQLSHHWCTNIFNILITFTCITTFILTPYEIPFLKFFFKIAAYKYLSINNTQQILLSFSNKRPIGHIAHIRNISYITQTWTKLLSYQAVHWLNINISLLSKNGVFHLYKFASTLLKDALCQWSLNEIWFYSYGEQDF